MTTARLLRKIHYWLSAPLFLTMFVIGVTGALLALKKDFDALQPPTRDGTRPGDLHRPVADLIAAVATTPGNRDVRWEDVDRIDVRPGKGIAKVVLHSRTEVQVDLSTGRVLQVGYRTSDWLETIHDFSFLGGWAKYGLSFGSGLAIVAMTATGAYLFAIPMLARRRKKARL